MTNTDEYGVFAGVVAAAGVIIAAAMGVLAAWRGRAEWEPSEQDVPKGGNQVAALAAGVVLVILFAEHREDRVFLVQIAIWTSIATVAALIVYGLLISSLTYRRIVGVSRDRVEISETIIGGICLTPEAKIARRRNGISIQEVFRGSGFDMDLVWPRPCRAIAKQLFVLAYMALIFCGTVALASAAMILVAGDTTDNQNILANPGFEDVDPDGSPARWMVGHWNDKFTATVDRIKRSGSLSGRIVSASLNDVGWKQTVTVEPNTEYLLEGWLKTRDVKLEEDAKVKIGANLCVWDTFDYSTGITGTSDWTYRKLQFNSGSRTRVAVACRLGYNAGTASGELWCDDLSLVALRSGPNDR